CESHGPRGMRCRGTLVVYNSHPKRNRSDFSRSLFMAKPTQKTERLIAENRKARFEYFIEERYEAGLVLQGWEVKSMRAGRAQLAEAYVFIRKAEAFLTGAHITPLKTTSTHIVADPVHTRKLLLNKHEI